MSVQNPLELPLPVVVDTLLPMLSDRDLASLRCVSKHAKLLVEDEVLWKRKVLADFTFPAYATARMGGWYRLYTGLSNPDIYVWGQDSNGRLGITRHERSQQMRAHLTNISAGIPYPIKLTSMSASRLGASEGQEQPAGAVVEIIAGGWSFHARTSTGQVWAWGTMNGEVSATSIDTLCHPGKVVSTPQPIKNLPPIRSLSGGRHHAVALSHDNRLLEWSAWGTIWEHVGFPAHLIAPPNSKTSITSQNDIVPITNVKQLEAGWYFSAILTQTGEIWLWRTNWSQAVFRGYQTAEEPASPSAPGGAHTKTWRLDITPVRLPPIVLDAEQQEREHLANKVVQIAAGEDFIVALTQAGTLHRLDMSHYRTREEDGLVNQQLFDHLHREHRDGVETHAQSRRLLDLTSRFHVFLESRAKWERLAAFEDPQGLPGFDSAWLKDGRGAQGSVGGISHISAQFRTFVVFHTVKPAKRPQWRDGQPAVLETDQDAQTLVLLGSSMSASPELIPQLQARGVIKVTMGDYHYGALTQKGEILTWGSFSKGALGNWHPPWASANQSTEADQLPACDQAELAEQADQDEQRSFSNLVPLPRVSRGGEQRGAFQPRIGFAARPRVGTAPRAQMRTSAARPNYQSEQDVAMPTPISIVAHAQHGAQSKKLTPVAFDIAFAGWHSSALVMQAPDVSPTLPIQRSGC